MEAFREGLLAIPSTNPGSADDWVIDSPDAIRIAEENGGARFRSKYPDAVIKETLCKVPKEKEVLGGGGFAAPQNLPSFRTPCER